MMPLMLYNNAATPAGTLLYQLGKSNVNIMHSTLKNLQVTNPKTETEQQILLA